MKDESREVRVTARIPTLFCKAPPREAMKVELIPAQPFGYLRLELAPRDAARADDRGERADAKLGMIGDGNRDGGVCELLLHHDVAPATSDLCETV
jgi:hypothetical protein